MKASELRIGNLVYDWSDQVCEITKIDSKGSVALKALNYDSYWEKCPISDIKPIPINKETISMLSFISIPNEFMGGINYFDQHVSININESVVRVWVVGGKIVDHIIFIHQVQNLNFALGGTK